MKRSVSGILLLDKSTEQSSNDALQAVKRMFQARKAGHTGTLDVRASGLLPICFGEATKVSQYLLDDKKSYVTEFIFGRMTTSGDLEGEVLEEKAADFLTREILVNAMKNFRGRIKQTPPMFSALKKNGVPLYKLARQGIEVERSPREVTIYQFELLNFGRGKAVFEVECSKGTYVRKIAEDLGRELGCGACVASLRRERLGNYEVNQSYSIESLEKVSVAEGLEGLDKRLLKIDSALTELPSVLIPEHQYRRLINGQQVLQSDVNRSGLLRLYNPNGIFFAVGELLSDGRLVTRRLING